MDSLKLSGVPINIEAAGDFSRASDSGDTSFTIHSGDDTTTKQTKRKHVAETAERSRKPERLDQQRERRNRNAGARVSKTTRAKEEYQRRRRESLLSTPTLESHQPKDMVAIAITNNKKRGKDGELYVKKLEALSQDVSTSEQRRRLEAASKRGPYHLGRTFSTISGRAFGGKRDKCTNGYTSQQILQPAADINPDHVVHPSIWQMLKGRIVKMLGLHYIWADSPSDEFLSFSMDPVFLVEHALGRHNSGQRGVFLLFVDRRKAKTITAEPAKFFPPLKLYNTYEVPNWDGWSKPAMIDLHPRKFTQEFLVHGVVLYKDDAWVPVALETLIQDGLYELFPAFQIPNGSMKAGLYTSQVLARAQGFPPSNVSRQYNTKHECYYRPIYSYSQCAKKFPFTNRILELAQKLARNFVRVAPDTHPAAIKAPLYIFLCFLCFEKRKCREPIFVEWLRDHYTGMHKYSSLFGRLTRRVASDVTDLFADENGNVTEGYTDVASNLPGVMQFLDLVRDACFAFGLPDLPANVVETRNALIGEDYTVEDAIQHKNDRPYTHYDPVKQQQKEQAQKEKRETKRKGKLDAAVRLTTEQTAVQHPTAETEDEADEEDVADESDSDI